ncbi:hypothetical protein PF004_g28542 [Phytophthora fragariae]|uniref:Tc1-like transposase DDE domain-containing protein n=1 Tax=Phytophthora fragariae TaxID=53985 RepID=A0A6G0MIB5_9STRA|nr:hypothetical protein PF004_g28542 [Phytophthora fragariae]
MPSDPAPKKLDDHARELAKQRVLRVFREGGDWKLAAIHNDLLYATARRAVVESGTDPKQRGGVRSSCVKMTVELMAKLEEYLDEDCRATLTDMCDRLLSDTGVSVSKSSVHRALQGMLYSTKKLRIEKATMNNSINKQKRKEFVEKLDGHISRGDMIVYQDETNFNLYLSRSEGWSRIGERAVVQLPPSQGKNLHIQGGVSAFTGLALLRTHEGSIAKLENAQFIADLFVAAQRTLEYQELAPSNKVVIVTDNAPAHSQVEDLARQFLTEDGIMNGNRLVLLRLGPYSPMLNPIESVGMCSSRRCGASWLRRSKSFWFGESMTRTQRTGLP